MAKGESEYLGGARVTESIVEKVKRVKRVT
jgi:hypothetical protein